MTAQLNEDIEFIRLPDVKKLTGVSTSRIYDMASKGLFPKQVKLGPRAVAWIKAEIIQWNRDQVAASRGPQASASTASK
ncbi:helix-turn-helix transcriptional regulator [Pseudomonas caspiana]|uniref:AlpA family transcriptional regulator n=1 Tax=Pseudomonas caspiana TaxID=1451454 RepID=A0A1Y3NT63_9PSED|nr:AlpA family transcriptional regulator [Pseudomonas caspiana]OUM70818.1 AlpA family transcriptional regulator [Pseudomonas caspiana]